MARNAMWFSLFCLILAVAALSDPLGEEELSSAKKAAAIFGFMTTLTLAELLLEREAKSSFVSMVKLAVVFFILCIVCIAGAAYDQDDLYPMLKIMTWLVLFATMTVVAVIVVHFRRAFGPYIRSNAEVY